jgi:LysM repeat protein
MRSRPLAFGVGVLAGAVALSGIFIAQAGDIDPPPTHYEVEAADTWQSIAAAHGLTADALQLANNLAASTSNSAHPRTGWILHLPAVVPVTTTSPPTTTTQPATTTTAMPTPSTTTTAPPVTTTTTVPPVTTQPPASGVLFSESFAGSQGLERFRRGVFHRERDAFQPPHPEWVLTTPWEAAHDTRLADCGDPNVHSHPVSAANDADMIFVCREHLMTTMSDVSGYSIVWFSPDQVFADVREVCWDATVSSDVMGDRQWWEVMVLPASGPDVTAIDWLAGTANTPSYGEAGAVVLGFGPDNTPHPKISIGDADPVKNWPTHPNWGAAYSNQATRIPHCFREVDGRLEYETVQAVQVLHPGHLPSRPAQGRLQGPQLHAEQGLRRSVERLRHLHLALGQH